jgi:uncharacterized OB-fold protein
MSNASGTSTFTLELPYKRSLGPVVGAFLTGLRDRRVVGVRDERGRVLVPPLEYDPQTAASLDDLVDVASTGTVSTWCWVEEPMPKHPLDRPFAWAMVTLDGADTPLLHALDAGTRDAVSTRMRVRIRWAPETRGHITDIACFEPDVAAGGSGGSGGAGGAGGSVGSGGTR